MAPPAPPAPRGSHPGRGGDAVVDHDRGLPGESDAGPVATEAPRSSFQLGSLALFNLGQLGVGDMGELHDLVVDDPDSVLADRAHPQLGLEGHTELAHHDHIERRVERLRDLEGHRHAAARKAQHHDVLAPQMLQPVR
jgi:hypothetical protein